MSVDGTYVPYSIDAWTGKAVELANYYYEDGRTYFNIDLDYADVALFAFEKTEDEKLHIVSTDADYSYAKDGSLAVRATESKEVNVELSDGTVQTYSMVVPDAYDITDWDLTVESWTAGTERVSSEETIGDVTTVNTKVETEKTDIPVHLDTLKTWDNIEEVGKEVSGLGHYEATFNWDAAAADGAYLSFGDKLDSSMKVYINGRQVGGEISQNPTKAKVSIAEGAEGADQYTGGFSWNKPVADISDYLVDGENSIVVKYSSSMTNAALASGLIAEEATNVGAWWGYHAVYRSYGPSQAVIIPFQEETI